MPNSDTFFHIEIGYAILCFWIDFCIQLIVGSRTPSQLFFYLLNDSPHHANAPRACTQPTAQSHTHSVIRAPNHTHTYTYGFSVRTLSAWMNRSSEFQRPCTLAARKLEFKHSSTRRAKERIVNTFAKLSARSGETNAPL